MKKKFFLFITSLLVLSTLIAQPDRVLPFYQGGKWGLAERKSGKTIMPPRYTSMKPLGEGYFSVEDDSQDEGIIIVDSTGKETLRLPEDIVLETNNGLFRHNNKGNHEWYHMSGRKLQFDTNEVLSAGKCYENRLMYSGVNGKEGFLDTYGKVVVKAEYDNVYAYSKGYGIIVRNDKWGAVDMQGKKVIPPIYEGVMSLGDGLFAVYKNKKIALATKNNQLLTGYDFDYIHEFYEGLAWVAKGKQFWFINSTGKNPFRKTYTKISSFENSRAIVRDTRNEMIIDRNGSVQYRVPAHYTVKGAMEGNFFEIEDQKTGTYLIVNPGGKLLFEGMSELPHESGKDHFAVKKDGKYGLINVHGNIALPLEFDQLAYSKEVDAWFAMQGDARGFLDENGRFSKRQSIKDFFIPDSGYNKASFYCLKNGVRSNRLRLIKYDSNKDGSYEITHKELIHDKPDKPDTAEQTIYRLTVGISEEQAGVTKYYDRNGLEKVPKYPIPLVKFPENGKNVDWMAYDYEDHKYYYYVVSWATVSVGEKTKPAIKTEAFHITNDYAVKEKSTWIFYYVEGMGLWKIESGPEGPGVDYLLTSLTKE